MNKLIFVFRNMLFLILMMILITIPFLFAGNSPKEYFLIYQLMNIIVIVFIKKWSKSFDLKAKVIFLGTIILFWLSCCLFYYFPNDTTGVVFFLSSVAPFLYLIIWFITLIKIARSRC